MRSSPPRASNNRFQWLHPIGYIGLAVVALLYTLQLASPLRVNNDVQRFLEMAWSYHCGQGFVVNGVIEQLPVGYPMLAGLIFDIGLQQAAWLTAVNLICITGFAIFWWQISCAVQSNKPTRLVGLMIVLLSWVLIKHAALPLSEPLFLFVATSALAALSAFWKQSKRFSGRLWILGLLLSLAATAVRTIGIALVVAALGTILTHPLVRMRLYNIYRLRRNLLLRLATSLVVITGIAGLLIIRSDWFETQFLLPQSYFQTFLRRLGPTPFSTIGRALGWHGGDFIQVALNVPLPTGKIPLVVNWLACAGSVSAATFLVSKTHETLRPISLYIAGYLAIYLFWPFADPRFLLPIVPWLILLGLSLFPFSALTSSTKRLVTVYLAVYFCLGFMALVYSTWLSFSGLQFPERFGHGQLRDSYWTAFGAADRADPTKVDQRIVQLLCRHEPLAQIPHEKTP